MTITLAKLNWRDGAHVVQVDEATGEFDFKRRRYRLDPRGESFAIQRRVKGLWRHQGMVAKFHALWVATLSEGDGPACGSPGSPYHAAVKALMRG